MKKKNILSLIVLVIFTLIIIKLSPSFFPAMMPDSYDYIRISNSNIRTSIYPGINQFFNFIETDIISFQIFLLSFSISLLVFAIFKKTRSFHLSAVLFFLISINYFYTSFSKTILTESLFFTFINLSISIILLVQEKRKIFFLVLGILLGLIITIKPIGITIALPLIVAIIIKRNSRNSLALLFPIIITFFIENYLFHLHHDKRSSVLPDALTGKIFFMSGSENFNYEVFPFKYHNMLNEIQFESKKVHDFIEKLKNPLLKVDLRSDYEVVFQFQSFNILEFKNEKLFNEFRHDKSNFLIYLKNNFSDYLALSLSHYIGQWLTGPKFLFLKNLETYSINSIPLYKNLILSSSDLNKPKRNILFLSLCFFILLFISFTYVSLASLFRIIKEKKVGFLDFLIISVQFYLIATSFINISSIRYLMPVYPIIIVVLILYINSKFNISSSNKNSKEIKF